MSIQPVRTEAPKPFQIVPIDKASELLHIPVATLRWYRHSGKGPKSALIGGRVMYRVADLEQWLNDQFDQA